MSNHYTPGFSAQRSDLPHAAAAVCERSHQDVCEQVVVAVGAAYPPTIARTARLYS